MAEPHAEENDKYAGPLGGAEYLVEEHPPERDRRERAEEAEGGDDGCRELCDAALPEQEG